MYNFVRMIVHSSICFNHEYLCTNNFQYYYRFLHAHLCTKSFPKYYRFSSFTSLYEWLSIFVWIFVMHIYVRMTIHIVFDFCHAHLRTNEYSYYYSVSVMHISVRMNIHIILCFCHAHLCTNYYPYYFWFLSCIFLYKLLSIGFCHAHLCTNDYFTQFLSNAFL